MLRAVAGHTARQFARAIVMPNLTPPVTRAADAVAYRERILAALPEGADFTPFMNGAGSSKGAPITIRPISRFSSSIARS